VGERELTEPITLCLPDGRLDPAAVGWSRRPLHRCNLRGRWPRKKRWDYWCVTGDDVMIALTWADVDYLGLAVASALDLASGALVEEFALARPGGAFAETVGGGDVAFERRGFALRIEPRADGTRLSARTRRLQIEITVEPPRESLSVVVPFDDARFQFTCKQIGLAARGRAIVDGRERRLDGAWAALDFGRGIWPHRTRWRWAAAAGTANGRAVAFNLGGLWTRGTGATENALFLDGRAHKLSDEIELDGQRLSSPAVELSFVPLHARHVGADVWPIGARLDWACGWFNGWLLAGGGERIEVRNLFGWNEEVRARW